MSVRQIRAEFEQFNQTNGAMPDSAATVGVFSEQSAYGLAAVTG
jgi:hypothetical protein